LVFIFLCFITEGLINILIGWKLAEVRVDLLALGHEVLDIELSQLAYSRGIIFFLFQHLSQDVELSVVRVVGDVHSASDWLRLFT
jgi:hypothetical protein